MDLATTTPNPSKSVATQGKEKKDLTLYEEPLNTPGVVPLHLKRDVNTDYPIVEIAQRLLLRLKPETFLCGNLEAILAAIALYKAAAPVYSHLEHFLLWAFTSQITISEFDPIAKDVFTWMSSNVIIKNNSTCAIMSTGESFDTTGYRRIIRMDMVSNRSSSTEESHTVPALGQRLFWVGFRPFLFLRNGSRATRVAQDNNRGSGPSSARDNSEISNSIVIRTLGWSLDPIQKFIKQCKDSKESNKQGTTTMYFSNGKPDPWLNGLWTSVTKATRKLDTIDIDDDIKNDLIRDAEYYYSDESKEFFAECGIPYRRGYMFYGPPGTGKTSFSAALAGHLHCDVYHINLATGDLNDGRLQTLFLNVPRKAIVVIEDIDSAGIGREQGPGADQHDPLGDILDPMPPPRDSHGQQPRGDMPPLMVTLSGLLNAIDGNASAEGRLLIMTSNSPHTLDEALTRPGRIDKKVYFGKMMPPTAKAIFKRLIGRTATAKLAYSDAQVDAYAQTFSEKLPADTFTPAQVQNLLQACRGDAEKAISDLDTWVQETLEKESAKLKADKARKLAQEEAREAALKELKEREEKMLLERILVPTDPGQASSTREQHSAMGNGTDRHEASTVQLPIVGSSPDIHMALDTAQQPFTNPNDPRTCFPPPEDLTTMNNGSKTVIPGDGEMALVTDNKEVATPTDS
ncbi:P-loop containing nucleoside triphosphate hydrolase protein [Massarina eburnea CBS 473.64]|uniref:P-loop containing nucleoside triphosphate hydrolase protein n=1 Tax=Massarina eburnea CBS 473.64 TaxID=1395130 RepID=A0A6A6RN83_9PLEO|nr:P-loop containing nucleoside triphosphate hydrolase protein [Massarina eburnea CBS 473.64]